MVPVPARERVRYHRPVPRCSILTLIAFASACSDDAVDPCAGVVCAPGRVCVAGRCLQPDSGKGDRGVDLPVDGAAPGDAADARADLGGDGAVELGVDAAADVATPDLPAPDGPTAEPCAAPAVAQHTVNATMVFCWDPVNSYNQCQASLLCAAGWHLCTPPEYRAVFAAAAPPEVMAWISGCVRNGGAPHAPTNTPCTCSPELGALAFVAWVCGSGGGLTGAPLYLGVATTVNCFRVGQNDPAYQAFWGPATAAQLSRRSVCCRD